MYRYNFFILQVKYPTKGCWAEQVKKDLKYIGLCLSFKEISLMTKRQFRNAVKNKINQISLKYLLRRQKSKGSEIRYKSLSMAEYLLPNDKFTKDQQIHMFSIRNRMWPISSNFKVEIYIE